MSDYNIRKGRTYICQNSIVDNSKISEVLYPFGYGLSYTRFSYGKLQVVSGKTDAEGVITSTIVVKNTGDRTGDEVVQLYASNLKWGVLRPEKQLVAFERVTLKPGESKTVELHFPAKELAFWDVQKKSFVVEPGEFRLMVGSSSKDIKSTGKFFVN